MRKYKLSKILLCTALSTTMQSALALPIYTTSFGSSGVGEGKFKNPDRIAIDSQGKIYISDYNNRVTIWNTQDNSWVGSFGTEGSDNSRFSLPSGVALNNQDKIYVADNKNNRVTVWNTQDNSWVGSFGTEGSDDGQLDRPTGITLDNNNKIYVADSFNNRITIWDAKNNNKWVGSFGSKGSDDGQLNKALDIALDNNDKIYVADTHNNRITIWDAKNNNKWVGSFGSKGSDDGQLDHPTGITLDNNNKIYVADSFNSRITMWDAKNNNKWVGSFRSKGSDDGQLNHRPNAVAVYQSKVYVSDYNNDKIMIWFEPSLWNSAGTVILGTLTLNQYLELKQDYNLQINEINDTTYRIDAKSDGILTITNKATLTAGIGSSISATKLVVDTGKLLVQTSNIPEQILYSDIGLMSVEADIKCNIDFAGKEGVLQLADNQTITGSVDSTDSSAGTLEFLGKGTVTGSIGDTNALTSLKFSGSVDNTLPKANAKTIEVANDSANVTATDLLTGNVLFSNDGTLLADKGVSGSITTTTDKTGTITIGSGNVGTIGADGKSLKLINLNQGEAASVGKIYATNVNIGGAGPITATDLITGDVLFSADGTLISNKGITGNIDFDSNAASLTFNEDDGDEGYTLDGTISNANSATLEVNTKLKVIDKSVGEIKTINIGKNGILSISSNDADLTLISTAGGSINFADTTANLILSPAQDQTIKLNGIIDGFDNGGGNVVLDGNGHNITLTMSDNVSLGTETKKLGAIDIIGNVTFDKSISANALNLDISHNGSLANYSTKSSTIGSINIGDEQGAGEYILDARDGDLSTSVDHIVFKNELSVLSLGSTSEDTERTITLKNSIVPDQDKYGILKFYSDKKLTIGSKDITFGTKTHRLKQITLSSGGNTEFDIEPKINVENLGLDLSKINLGEVNANIIFYKDTQYNANGNINGSIDFAGNDGVINIADNIAINGIVSSTDTANGTLNFLGSSSIRGVVTNISTMQAGAGDVTFSTSGDYSMGELKGNGSSTITFPSGMNFTGDINTTGGDPLNLSFAESTNINGNIGSSSSPVGNISSSNNVQFTGDINSSGDVITSGATVFASNVTCNNIIANKTSLITLTSAFTASSSNTIYFDEAKAVTQFQGTVNTKGNIEVNGSTYFTDTVNSQGNVVINGDTRFNNTLSSNNNVSISSGSNTIFNSDVSSSSINIDNANIGIVNNISIRGNISANNSTIVLDNNKLTLSGTNSISNQITISISYDEFSLSGGNIIILTSGSTLDLSNVSQLTIKLAFINSDISNITDDTKYNIILAEDGSNIVLLNDPENQIILDSSGEQNRFLKWTLDARSLTLYASDDSNNVIDYIFDSVENNTFMQELNNALPDSLAQKFKKNIGLLSKKQVEDMFARILDHSKERSSDIVQVALHQALTDTNRTAMNVINNRLLGSNPTIVAAGDVEVSKYGVWARSSINQSKDKVNGKRAEYFSSYKTKGHSNTIGVDGLICDNLLVGMAYTNAYTSIRPEDQNIGNVDKVRTNMFSLYSAYNIPNYDWYLGSTISYAESSIRGQKIRYLAVARDVLGSETASSKYKSRLYSGSVSVGYNHHIGEDIYVTPSIGVIGSLIRDRGYTESGTSFQNLTVGKKNYNKLSSIAGLRTYQNIYIENNVGGMIVTPEAYGFVNYNIKNKTPVIDARLPGIDERLPTISHRSNRVDYNLGLGITIKQNMMEYGINYDANLAKKYQGHSGSLKVRVNL